ncbi:MAG: M1 family metallopeptidase [Ferruginibacter sp.]
MKSLSILLLLLSSISKLIAQDTLPVPANIRAAYAKQTRDRNGSPGPKYWQNTANYDINVNFDPASRLVKGSVKIVYKNSSPDTLRELWFKLYPNLYKKGNAPANIKPEDQHNGMSITGMRVNRSPADLSTMIIDGTNMHMPVQEVLPGRSVTLNVDYNYTLNKGSHVRTGQVDPGSYFIAYFFPRVAVYDDVDGWNKYPYRGSEEFYNDFCNFKASITVPDNFVVWATGDLRNAKSVLNKPIVKRIKRAERSDDVIYVIDSMDMKAKNVTKHNALNTWKFTAGNVTDFVFALSDHYIWRSTSLVVDRRTGRRTRVDAAFNPIHKDYFEVIDFARKTVEAMSYTFPAWPFPYSHETVFDGLDQMEYPMMVNDNPVEKREDAITLTDHEIFHTMFPFYMGTNETKYGWMDEGWATIGEWLISSMIDTTYKDDYGITPTARSSGEKDDSPIMTLTPDNKGTGLFTNSYPKPAFGYLFVKDYLGDELFTKALHHYIEKWHGKHPMPYDFFYSMNAGSGKNMDWFWKRWFFEGGVTDMAVTGVKKESDGYTITVENKSQKPMPVDVTVTYTDGSQGVLHKNIGVWQLGEKLLNIKVDTDKVIRKVQLGSFYVPDKVAADNIYEVK